MNGFLNLEVEGGGSVIYDAKTVIRLKKPFTFNGKNLHLIINFIMLI